MNRSEELTEIRAAYQKYFEHQPEHGGRFMAHFEAVYQGSVFEAKTKHLIALCGGIIAGCKGCILGQADLALEKGATAQEVLEVCSISMSLGGTLAGSQVTMVMQLLDERGLLEQGGSSD